MKTLFLVAVLMFFGSFVFANDEKFPNDEIMVDKPLPCENYVPVYTDCGNDFWLCTDDISFDDLIDQANYFAGIKCP